MAGDPTPVPAWPTLTDEQIHRWAEVLDTSSTPCHPTPHPW
jgi:hypothetical protein